MMTMFKDIIAKKRREETGPESEFDMGRAFLVAPVAMGVVSENIIRHVNNRFCNITGYSREELIGRNANILCPTDEDYAYVTEESFRQIQENGTSTLETRLVCRDGGIIEVVMSSNPLNTTDLSAGLTFSALDITEGKLTEGTHQESEERYKKILQTATDGFMLTDSDDGRLIDVNDAYCTMSGYTKEELLSMKIYDLVASESLEEVRLRGIKIMEKGGDWFETQHLRKDGSILDLEVSIKFYPDDKRYYFSFLKDITEKKQAEMEREKLQAQLSNALEIANLGPWEYDITNDLFTFTDQYYKVYRTTVEEQGGYTMSSEEVARRFIPPDEIEDLESVDEAVESIDEESGNIVEHRQIFGDGTIGYVSIKSFVIKDNQGNPIRTYGVNQDITKQKQAEMEREKMQAQLSKALEVANLAPWEYDVANDLFTLNDHFFRLHRTTVEEVGGYEISSEEYILRFVHPDDIPIVEKSVEHSIDVTDPESEQRVEFRVLLGDGSVGYTSVKMLSIKDDQGKTVYTYGVNQDITNQKQAEIEREKLQAQLSNAVEIAHLGPWEYDVANDLFTFNDHFYKIFGTTAEEVGGYTLSSSNYAQRFCHPDDLPLVGEEVRKAIETTDPNYSQQMEHRMLYADGTVGWISVRISVIKDENGQTIRTYGANQDITESKQVEMEWEKMQALFSNALEITDLAPWEFDVARDVFIFNDHFYNLFRTTAEEVGGYEMSPDEFARRFVHPDETHLFRETLKEDKAPGQNIKRQMERHIIFGDGNSGYISVNLLFIKDEQGNTIRIYGATQDITEKKKEEIEREKLQAQLSNAVEIADLAPWEYDIANDLFTFNDIFYKVFRTTAEEVGGYTMSSSEYARRFFHPDEHRAFEERLRESGKGKDPDSGQRVEHRIIFGDGTPGYISVIPFIVKDNEGNAVRTYGASLDITKQKQAEIEKEKLQAQLSNALDIANLGPWEYDIANDLFTFNDHFYKVFRTTAEEVGGYTMSSSEYASRFVHPDDIHMVAEAVQKSTEAEDPDFSQRIEHRIVYGDGTLGHIAVKIFLVKDSQGKTIRTYGVNQDITEQKRIEEELLRTQKLDTVGLLAGGIAHDFNNILTTILGNTYMAKMEVDPENEVFELLREMETASSRAQTLTKQLLTFAKGGTPVKETSSIKEVITESSIFVLRGSKSSCEFSIVEDLWPVDVDVGQINQVINNVVMNANQAMPDGGKIRVTGENLIIEDKHGLPIKPGRYIRISITDQGQGIAKEDIVKVFDPFFTTKPEGNGLGLATVYSIIKKHDGHINVESVLGKSTTFQIYLPASERRARKREEGVVIPGAGRILVMDDEAPLRKMVEKMLKKLGYMPDFTEDGAEAVEAFRAAKDTGKPYDAVILDLTVPGGMGGKDAVKKILKIDPEAKVIVSSGYSEDLVLADFKQYGFKGILPKPFESRSMSQVLSEVIQGKTES